MKEIIVKMEQLKKNTIEEPYIQGRNTCQRDTQLNKQLSCEDTKSEYTIKDKEKKTLRITLNLFYVGHFC